MRERDQRQTTRRTSHDTAPLRTVDNMLTLQTCTRTCSTAECDTKSPDSKAVRSWLQSEARNSSRPTGSGDTFIVILRTFLRLYDPSILNSGSSSARGCIRQWQHYVKKQLTILKYTAEPETPEQTMLGRRRSVRWKIMHKCKCFKKISCMLPWASNMFFF